MTADLGWRAVAVFGQGIRCVGGSILCRVFYMVASGGSLTAPDLAAGDATVSAQSTILGDPFQAGDRRGYLVYYRDGIVLGGCAATSMSDATQSGMVAWSP